MSNFFQFSFDDTFGVPMTIKATLQKFVYINKNQLKIK